MPLHVLGLENKVLLHGSNDQLSGLTSVNFDFEA